MLLGSHCSFCISLLFILRLPLGRNAMFCSAVVDLLEQSKSPSRKRQQPVQEQSRAVASGAAGGEMRRSIQPLKTLGWSLVLTTHCDVTHPVHPRRLLWWERPTDRAYSITCFVMFFGTRCLTVRGKPPPSANVYDQLSLLCVHDMPRSHFPISEL
jgi:hypothetical protein